MRGDLFCRHCATVFTYKNAQATHQCADGHHEDRFVNANFTPGDRPGEVLIRYTCGMTQTILDDDGYFREKHARRQLTWTCPQHQRTESHPVELIEPYVGYGPVIIEVNGLRYLW